MRSIVYAVIVTTFLGFFQVGPVCASEPQLNNPIEIIIGGTRFAASVENNATANALLDMLPLTLDMTELNGNEKLYRFPAAFPSKASNPGRITTGDIMLYGDKTLVIFYKSFPTSYSYTRIGRIENAEALGEALGSGSVTVTLERGQSR